MRRAAVGLLARWQEDSDHVATCKDGNRYRVFVNAEGRAVAQKL